MYRSEHQCNLKHLKHVLREQIKMNSFQGKSHNETILLTTVFIVLYLFLTRLPRAQHEIRRKLKLHLII